MANWYVNYDAGNDSTGDGSIGDPYKTIDKAIDVCSAGDTIHVRGAPTTGGKQYENSGNGRGLEPSKSGTAGNPITVQVYSGETVSISGATAGNRVALYLSGVDYFDWKNLTFDYLYTNVDTDNEGMIQMWSADHHNFTSCVFNFTQGDGSDLFDNDADGFSGHGFQIGGTSHSNVWDDCEVLNQNIGMQFRDTVYDNTIKNSHIHHCYWSAVVVRRSTGQTTPHPYRLLVEDTTIEWLFGEDGLQCDGEDGYLVVTDMVFRRCIFRGIGENAVDFKAAQRVLIEDCYIYGIVGSNDGNDTAWNRNSWYAAITGSGDISADVIFRGNVFFDCPSLNVGLGSGSGDGYQIYNNTFISCNRDFTGPNTVYTGWGGYAPAGVTCTTSPKNSQFVNNISVGHNEVSFYLKSDTNMRVDYNMWDGPNSLSGSEGATLAAWQSLLEADSLIWGDAANDLLKTHAQVKFVDVADDVNVGQISGGNWDGYPDVTTYVHSASDFGLQSDSPAINAGGPITYANGAGTNSTQLACDHVRWAYDGFGISGETGDQIIINGQSRTVADIDYTNKTITLSSTATWSNNDPVYLTAYGGTSPDMGAIQFDVTPPPRKSILSWLELEVPDNALRNAILSWLELQAPGLIGTELSVDIYIEDL
jgi:hypothetical protein